MSERTVADLLAAVIEGDHAAFDVLVERYVRLVWSIIRGYRIDTETGKDVVQTVWTQLYVQCGQIRHPERLASWLATTTKNECLRVLRQQQRLRPTEDAEALLFGTAPPVDESVVRDESRREVLAAFNELRPECQQLLRLLVTDEELDYATIAEIVGRPVGSIGPTRARCLDRLRRILERRIGPDGSPVAAKDEL